MKKLEYSPELVADIMKYFCKGCHPCDYEELICDAAWNDNPLLIRYIERIRDDDCYAYSSIYGRVLDELDAWEKANAKPQPKLDDFGKY